jgi:hypothetical protein
MSVLSRAWTSVVELLPLPTSLIEIFYTNRSVTRSIAAILALQYHLGQALRSVRCCACSETPISLANSIWAARGQSHSNSAFSPQAQQDSIHFHQK